MGGENDPRRFSIARVLKVVCLFLAVPAVFAAGVWVGPLLRPTYEQKPVRAVASTWLTSSAYDASKGFPRPDAPLPVDPRLPEPDAVAARAAAIRRDADRIRNQCQRAAGGDWGKWVNETARYRTALKAKVDGLKDLPPPQEGPLYEAMGGRDGFPLFEVDSRKRLAHLIDPAKLDSFRHDRPVLAVDRWLRRQGIDLIFVPLPAMTEVYVEHFLDPCPPDGVIAPYVQKTILDLLEQDVEVVDGLSLFRAVRDTDTEYLYNTADNHWAPRGMRVMAKELADRVLRYKFGASARYRLPIVRVAPGPYEIRGNVGGFDEAGWSVLLRPDQQALARPHQTTTQAEVRLANNWPLADDPNSPVVVVGHSYVPQFWQQLVKELNLLVQKRNFDDQTTELFTEFLRQPELLAHCRVLIWISTEYHMTRFKPLPEPILRALPSGG